jgi:hypothetical protein
MHTTLTTTPPLAQVNPLNPSRLHIAESIVVLLLPCACALVAYAIRGYVRRSKQLHYAHRRFFRCARRAQRPACLRLVVCVVLCRGVACVGMQAHHPRVAVLHTL